MPLRDPPRAGVCWIDHDLPSHTSANGLPPAEVEKDPTAMQNVADVQETSDSPLIWAPGGLGVV